MSPFLIYIARAGLYLSLFYAFYLMVMRRTTFFRLNRTLLLSGSLSRGMKSYLGFISREP